MLVHSRCKPKSVGTCRARLVLIFLFISLPLTKFQALTVKMLVVIREELRSNNSDLDGGVLARLSANHNNKIPTNI